MISLVPYAHEQALLCLGFYPNMWYQAALYLEDRSKQLLERGVSFYEFYCVRRRRTLPNRDVTAGCYVNSRFSVYVALPQYCLQYLSFAQLNFFLLTQAERTSLI